MKPYLLFALLLTIALVMACGPAAVPADQQSAGIQNVPRIEQMPNTQNIGTPEPASRAVPSDNDLDGGPSSPQEGEGEDEGNQESEEDADATPTPTPYPTVCVIGENAQGTYTECFEDIPPTPQPYPGFVDHNVTDQIEEYERAANQQESISGQPSINHNRVIYLFIETQPGHMDTIVNWLEDDRDTVDIYYENNHIEAGVRIRHLAALAALDGIIHIQLPTADIPQ